MGLSTALYAAQKKPLTTILSWLIKNKSFKYSC